MICCFYLYLCHRMAVLPRLTNGFGKLSPNPHHTMIDYTIPIPTREHSAPQIVSIFRGAGLKPDLRPRLAALAFFLFLLCLNSFSAMAQGCSGADPCVENFDEYLCIDQGNIGLIPPDEDRIIVQTFLDINQPHTFPQGTDIIMLPGARLHVRREVVMDNVTIRGCGGEWVGISVFGQGNLHFTESEISNAAAAFTVSAGGRIDVLSSSFTSNTVGLVLNAGGAAEVVYNVFTNTPTCITATDNVQLMGGGISLNTFNGVTGVTNVAAIRLVNVPYAAIGTHGLNTFSNFNGKTINIFNSNVDILNADISGLFGESIGVFCESTNGTHQVNILGPNVAFTQLMNGVEGLDCNLTVDDCTFTLNETGIRFANGLLSAAFRASNNRFFSMYRRAINVSESILSSGIVEGNTIIDDNTAPDFVSHIGINWSRVRWHKESSIRNNTFTDMAKSTDFFVRGINLNSTYGARVQGNTITQAFQPSGNYDFNGIRSFDSHYNAISSNTISGQSHLGNGIAGIYSLNSYFQGIGCNTVMKLRTGIKFEGRCDGTDFRENKIEDDNGTGLHLMNGSVIGEQFFSGNLWLGQNPLGLEGLAEGDDATIAMSRFYIQTPETSNSAFWAIPRSPGGDMWFRYENNGSDNPYHYNFTCISLDEVDPNNPSGSKTAANKASIAGDYPAFKGYPASVWEADMAAYALLWKHPEQIDASGPDNAFMTQHQDANTGKLARAVEAWHRYHAMPTALSADWEQNRTAIIGKRQAVADQEALLGITTDPTAQDAILQTLSTLKSELGALQAEGALYAETYRAHCVGNLDALLLALAAVSPGNGYEQNLKTVLVLLATQAKTGNAWTAAELAVLNSIAAQCRYEGGLGVVMARGALEQSDYDDEALCPGVEERSAVANALHSSSAPNPADEYCQIRFGEALNGMLTVFNAQGNPVQTLVLSEASNCDLSTSTWPNGVYYATIRPEKGVPQTFRLRVLHR